MKKLLSARVNRQLLRYNLNKYRGYLFLFTVFLVTLFPVPNIIRQIYRTNLSALSPPPPVALVIFSIILLFVTPFIIYNFLFSKKAVDVYHALPIKREDLFITQNLTIYLLVVIPFTIAYILGYGLLAAFGYSISSFVIYYYFVFIAMAIVIIAPTVLVIMNTGTLSDAIIHSFILFMAPFIVYGAINSFASTFIFSIRGFAVDNLKVLSPQYWAVVGLGEISTRNLHVMTVVTIYWLLLNLIMTSFTVSLYANRKSEKSETPFVNNRYFPFVTGAFICFLFVIISTISRSIYGETTHSLSDFLSFQSLSMAFLLTYVGYIVLDFFRYRTTKNLLKSSLSYLAMIGGTLIFCSLLIITQVFGAAWIVPRKEKIATITIPESSLYYIHPIFQLSSESYNNRTIVLSSPESISEFTTFHHNVNKAHRGKKQLSDQFQNGNYDNSCLAYETYNNNLDFSYKMESGRTMRRSFILPKESILELAELVNNADYQTQIHPLLKTGNSTVLNLTLFNNIMSEATTSFDSSFRDSFRRAYLSDIEKLTSQEINFSSSSLRYILSYSISEGKYTNDTFPSSESQFMFIDTRYTETITLLDKHFVNTFNVENDYVLLNDANLNVASSYGFPLVRDYYGDIENQHQSISSEKALSLADKVEGSHCRKKSRYSLVINQNILLPIDPKWDGQ